MVFSVRLGSEISFAIALLDGMPVLHMPARNMSISLASY